MIVAERILHIRSNSAPGIPVHVRLFSPVSRGKDWSCSYEIEWPLKLRAMKAHGVDASQALILALHMIGSELYSSKYHAERTLIWLEAGKGYGFPVASLMRDALIGDDADL